MNDILGPAVDIPEFLAALTLLQIRGCRVTWRPLEVYEVGYRRAEDVPGPVTPARCRLFYADRRGTQQALQLLRELADAVPSTANLDDVVKTGCEV